MEDDCRLENVKLEAVSLGRHGERRWDKWSLEETNGNNNTQQTETTTTTTTSLSMDGNQSRRQSMDLDTTSHSRENNNMIIISPSSMHGNNNNTTANALRRTVSASDVSGKTSVAQQRWREHGLASKTRDEVRFQEQKYLKEFHFLRHWKS